MLEFSDKKIVGTVNIPIKISESDIENIVVSSFEGGSNYWLGVDNSQEEWEDKPKEEPMSTWATKIILEKNPIGIYDIEDEEEIHILTFDKILSGIKQNAMERKFDSDLENMDSTTADCIIQYALFGKIVFG